MSNPTDLPAVALKLPRSIRSVHVPSGEGGSTLAYERKVAKKKHSWATRRVGKMAQKLTKAEVTMLETYLDSHKRSNQKKKNGWRADFRKNLRRAAKKGYKKL